MFEREENPKNITKADIVVGIPSFNEADSIAFTTQQASLGLKEYFQDMASVIINGDNCSFDGTESVFLNTATEVPKIYITTPPDTVGKGYNIENMLRKTLELGAKVFICVDADLTSITPEWIKYLVEPILEGYDFTSPVYSRDKYDGTITNTICFPLIYALFCQNIRQPIGGEFALSSSLIKYLISQPWHRTTREYGIDIFMSMHAVIGGFKICKTGLGAKNHKPSAPKLDPMFIQVVSTAFLIVTHNYYQWKNLKNIRHTPLFGLKNFTLLQNLNINRNPFERKAREEFRRYKNQHKKFLSKKVYSEIDYMFSYGSIEISNEQWVTIIYDMIYAFNRTGNKELLVETLKGLYFGRTLSFMKKTREWKTEKVEEEILSQARCFYKNRGYLIKKLEL